MNKQFTEVANISELKKITTDHVKESVLFITGFSGGGKNWLAHKLMTNPKLWLFLDELGKETNGKWEIDLKSVKDYSDRLAVVGSSDNFKNVVKTFLDSAGERVKIVKVVVPIPEPALFRAICAAKAADYRGEHESWRKYWLDLSKMTDAKTVKHINEKVSRTLKDFVGNVGGRELLLYTFPHSREGDVKRGWHELRLSKDAKDLEVDYPHKVAGEQSAHDGEHPSKVATKQ